MQDNGFRPLAYVAHHDPAVIVGLMLIGGAIVLYTYVQLQMIRAGYKSSSAYLKIPILAANNWNTLVHYLKVRANHGWSPWPVYLLGPLFFLGVVILIIGLVRL